VKFQILTLCETFTFLKRSFGRVILGLLNKVSACHLRVMQPMKLFMENRKNSFVIKSFQYWSRQKIFQR